MRTLYLLATICISLVLTGCGVEQPANNQVNKPVATPPIQPPPCMVKKKKNPLTVSFYTKGHPKEPYIIVGQESISKFNMGNKRQEANIRDGMRELAAAMGGDAVIDIKHDAKSITGTVVAYQKEDTITIDKQG